MENTDENRKKIRKIQKKSKLNSDNKGKYGRRVSRIGIRYGKYGRKASWIVKWYKNMEENCEMIWKIWKKTKLNSNKIWKILKKIVKWYGTYGRKPSWIVIRYGKYRRKLWNNLENMEENQVE